jgi:putative MFS transporter
VDFNDGVELLSTSIITPILKREWEIPDIWIQVLSSIFYLGMFIGALITGNIADKQGRRITIIWASAIQFIIAFSFSIINNLFLLIICRFLYGFCYGFSLPLTISMVSEIVPMKYRGKCIILIYFCVSIGKVWGILLAYMVLNDFDYGNWRALMVLCYLSSLIVVFGVYTYVLESPRFLLSIHRFEEAFEVINKIGYINKADGYKELTDNEKDEMRYLQALTFKKDDQANPYVLFQSRNFPITIRLWIIWFAMIFIEFGQYVILPFILQSEKGGFGTLLFAIAGELPAIFISFYFIDKENLGRKNTLTYCLFGLTALNFILYIVSSYYLGVLLSFERFLMKTAFSMLVPLTSELYPTNYRTVGYGFATGVGRLAATLCPFFLLTLFYYDTYSGFLLFTVLSIAGSYASWTLPFDTSGVYLDSFLERETQ